ncbi:hypothetical protein CC86DRAFT_87407 [Ophiobolus disseminans]|uniref:Uncharacterized protein n=1 Tax=Ophiobolus disseminans TaxID=1469910 RepID=A0A6A7AG44_9PLEO|nr:hypothetical protein CC86DRAFT_87407 [Ophiobolus disseminans]
MIRQRKIYGDFTARPPSEASDDGEDSTPSQRPSKARRLNVYDAVAGKVTLAGLVGNVTDIKASKQPLRPDEVLFKQKKAPIRYEETDYYFAHEKLPANQQLPSGDLLSAIHAYVSKLYSRTPRLEADKAWKCMDETALIAFGILLEETAKEVLGETGDLAFTEAAGEEEEEHALASPDGDDGKQQEQESAAKAAEEEKRGRSEPWSSSDDDSQYTTDSSN